MLEYPNYSEGKYGGVKENKNFGIRGTLFIDCAHPYCTQEGHSGYLEEWSNLVQRR